MNKLLEENSVYLIIGAEGKLTQSSVKRFESNLTSVYIFIDYPEFLKTDLSLPANIKTKAFSGDLGQDLIDLSGVLSEKELVVVPDQFGSTRLAVIMEQLEYAVNQVKYHLLTVMYYAEFHKSALLNVFDLNAPLIEFSEWCEGRDAIVLGAAPSIDLHLSWVKEHQDQFVIFAAVRLAKRLYAEGITPDFLVSIDPSDATIAHSALMEKFQNTSVLVIQHSTNHKLVDRWQGSIIYWGPEYPYFSKKFSKPMNIEMNGGTVSNYAVLTALGMGCKKVFITGMDLCFVDSEKTHESSSLERSNQQTFFSPEMVETYSGLTVSTTVEFKKAAEKLPRQIESLVHDYGLPYDFELFNLYQDAAKVQYIDHISLSDIPLAKTHKKDTKNLIEKLSQSRDVSKKTISKKIAQLNKTLKIYREQLQYVAQIRKHLESFSEDGMFLPDAVAQMAIKVEKLDKKIEKKSALQHNYVRSYGVAQFAKATRLAEMVEQNSSSDYGASLLRYYVEYFKAFAATLNQLIQIHHQAIQKGNVRIDELCLEGDVEKLLDFWPDHNLESRGLFWIEKHNIIISDYSQSVQQKYQLCLDRMQEASVELLEIAKNTMSRDMRAHISSSEDSNAGRE